MLDLWRAFFRTVDGTQEAAKPPVPGYGPAASLSMALALGLSLTLAPSPTRSAEDPTVPDLEDTAARSRPILLCTSPWHPFVAIIPPLRPPGPKPDPVALGFVPPPRPDAGDDGDAARDTATPSSPDDEPRVVSDPVVLPPPLPEAPIDPRSGADAGDAAADTATPATDVPVRPPQPPLTKRLGRILFAKADERRRASASVVGMNGTAPPSSPVAAESEDVPGAAEANPQTAMESIAAPNDTGSDADQAPSAEPPDDGRDAPAPADSPAPQDQTDGEGTEPSDPAETDSRMSALAMPTARAVLPRGRAGGPLSEIITAACRMAGLSCRVALVPWMRPHQQVANGPCDGIFPIEATDTQAGFLTFSNPLAASRLAFFTLGTDVETIADMREYIVLTEGPSDIADDARRLVEDMDQSQLVQGPDMADMLRQMSRLHPSDRVALYGNYHAILALMDDLEDITVPALTVVPHRQQLFRVGFGQDRIAPDTLKAFNAALTQVVNSPAGRETLEERGLYPQD